MTATRVRARPPPRRHHFPEGNGQTLEVFGADLPEGPIFAPSTSVMRADVERVGFALFDAEDAGGDTSSVAVYSARPDGGDVQGPFIAGKTQSIAVKPQYRSAQTEADLANGDTIWVATVPFERQRHSDLRRWPCPIT